jgi:hypothetical protein
MKSEPLLFRLLSQGAGGLTTGWLAAVRFRKNLLPVSPMVVVFSAASPEEVEVAAEDLASLGLPGVVLFNVEPVAEGLFC